MRLPTLNQRGIVVPLLPVLGIALLAIGVAVAVSLATNTQESTDIRSKASEEEPFETFNPRDVDIVTTPPPTPTDGVGPKRNFSDLLNE